MSFAPPVDRATLADYYRASDLTIVPSFNESFGLAALESEACGTLPVVAAQVGGAAHIRLPTASPECSWMVTTPITGLTSSATCCAIPPVDVS